MRRFLCLLLTALIILTGCSGAPKASAASGSPYPIPEFLDSGFHEELAVNYGQLFWDGSALELGYAALRAHSETRLKLEVTSGDQKYYYNIPSDGTDTVIPMNMGDGVYSFRLMENVRDDLFACIWSGNEQVQLLDEFQCFLRPSQIAPYSADSQCVALAAKLAADCSTDSDLVAAIYAYLVKNIDYDYEKAETVRSGYLPNPDDTLASGKGICFDYASLAAAMMRSMGIPCKVIFGYVDGQLYHAWNCFYLENEGWVTRKIQAPANKWQRVDITRAAGGTSEKELMDDGHYTTRYTY